MSLPQNIDVWSCQCVQYLIMSRCTAWTKVHWTSQKCYLSYNLRTVSDTYISMKLYLYWRLLLSVFVWITLLCPYSCEQTGSCRVKAHYNFCGEWTLAICHNHGEGWGQGFLKGRALAPRVGLKVHITLVPYLSTKRSPSGHLRDKGSSYSCTCLTLETPYKENYSLCWGTLLTTTTLFVWWPYLYYSCHHDNNIQDF